MAQSRFHLSALSMAGITLLVVILAASSMHTSAWGQGSGTTLNYACSPSSSFGPCASCPPGATSGMGCPKAAAPPALNPGICAYPNSLTNCQYASQYCGGGSMYYCIGGVVPNSSCANYAQFCATIFH